MHWESKKREVHVLPSAGRLLLRERDVLNLPVVISGVEDVDGSGYVLQAALGKEALGTQGRGQGGRGVWEQVRACRPTV